MYSICAHSRATETRIHFGIESAEVNSAIVSEVSGMRRIKNSRAGICGGNIVDLFSRFDARMRDHTQPQTLTKHGDCVTLSSHSRWTPAIATVRSTSTCSNSQITSNKPYFIGRLLFAQDHARVCVHCLVLPGAFTICARIRGTRAALNDTAHYIGDRSEFA